MVYAKAGQHASAECRLQFVRVRKFFDDLHSSRKEALLRQHTRSQRLQGVMHRLNGADPRVISLDQQIADRVYQKKLGDLNELHMAQNFEEAIYLESMVEILDRIQAAKETAAREIFELDIQNFRKLQDLNSRRLEELKEFAAEAALKMSKLVAYYTQENAQDQEDSNEQNEKVERMERHKQGRKKAMSVSELYGKFSNGKSAFACFAFHFVATCYSPPAYDIAEYHRHSPLVCSSERA